MADAYSLGGTLGGAAIGGVFGLANQALAHHCAEQDRTSNFFWNEKAANAADARTRALYENFYAPEALIKQYQKAGLSPSLMYGNTPGGGGQSGAMGHGAAGIQTPYQPISLMEGAQLGLIAAQTQKTKAEAQNIKSDTDLKELEKQANEWTNETTRKEFEMTNSKWTIDGKETSLFELADECYTYEEFLSKVRSSEDTDKELKEITTTEVGQKTLRSIFEAASKLNRDIMILSQETVNANFQIEVLNQLKKVKYEELNAEAAVSQLRQSISTNELTQNQKDAWNNLINRLGKKGSTWRDVVIVLGMILGNFASHTGIKLNLGK